MIWYVLFVLITYIFCFKIYPILYATYAIFKAIMTLNDFAFNKGMDIVFDLNFYRSGVNTVHVKSGNQNKVTIFQLSNENAVERAFEFIENIKKISEKVKDGSIFEETAKSDLS